MRGGCQGECRNRKGKCGQRRCRVEGGWSEIDSVLPPSLSISNVYQKKGVVETAVSKVYQRKEVVEAFGKGRGATHGGGRKTSGSVKGTGAQGSSRRNGSPRFGIKHGNWPHPGVVEDLLVTVAETEG
jgi:hypothetical protein